MGGLGETGGDGFMSDGMVGENFMVIYGELKPEYFRCRLEIYRILKRSRAQEGCLWG